jgi:hypothetical protein
MITNKIGKITGSMVRGTKDAPALLKGKVAEAKFAFQEGWNETNPSDKADEPDTWDPWANLPE